MDNVRIALDKIETIQHLTKLYVDAEFVRAKEDLHEAYAVDSHDDIIRWTRTCIRLQSISEWCDIIKESLDIIKEKENKNDD